MPFCREKVKNPAVNYRGAKKIGGAKTRSESVERGTDIPQIKHKIGNTPSRLGRSRAFKLLSLPLSYCIHTTKQPANVSVYAVSQPILSQIVANLSLMRYYPAMVKAYWWRPWQGVPVKRPLPAMMRPIPDTCYTCQGKILYIPNG